MAPAWQESTAIGAGFRSTCNVWGHTWGHQAGTASILSMAANWLDWLFMQVCGACRAVCRFSSRPVEKALRSLINTGSTHPTVEDTDLRIQARQDS